MLKKVKKNVLHLFLSKRSHIIFNYCQQIVLEKLEKTNVFNIPIKHTKKKTQRAYARNPLVIYTQKKPGIEYLEIIDTLQDSALYFLRFL